MKPTSYIFLVMAAVLLFGGFITCTVAETMAKSQGVAIFEQTKNSDGDYVYKYDISNDKVSKLSLNFNDVDVTIVGGATESYVELKNFDPYSYSSTLSGSSISIDGNVSGLSSLVDLSGGGFKFKGFRYFFKGDFGKGRERSVTIYISEYCEVTSLSLKLINGNLTVKNVHRPIDYNIVVDNGTDIRGKVVFDTVSTESMINLDLTSTDAQISKSESASFNIEATSSKVSIDLSKYAYEFITYNVKSTESQLIYNGSLDDDGQMKVTVSSDLQKCVVKFDCTLSEIVIIDNASAVAP